MDFDYNFIEVFDRGKFLIFWLFSGIWQFRFYFHSLLARFRHMLTPLTMRRRKNFHRIQSLGNVKKKIFAKILIAIEFRNYLTESMTKFYEKCCILFKKHLFENFEEISK